MSSLFKYVRFLIGLTEREREVGNPLTASQSGGRFYFVTTLGMLCFTFLLV